MVRSSAPAVQCSLFEHSERRDLGYGAWIDYRSGWFAEPHIPGGSARLDEGEAKLGAPHIPGGSARLDEGETKLEAPHIPGDPLSELRAAVPWRAERRQMYDRVLDVPRLVSYHDLAVEDPPHPLLARLRRRLNDVYAGELGEPFTTVGLCLYRDGADSVAWHGDTLGRGRTEDTMVAIVSLGATRTLALRPVHRDDDGGRSSLRLPQRHGDLLVMGGSCQRTWEHAVPKTTAPVGPRISVQFRPRGVR